MTDSLSRRNFIKASGLALGSTALPATPMVASAATAKALASNPPDVTRQLASWLVASEWSDIPERTRYEAVRSIFNWVGCCLGGARHETTDRAIAALAEFSGKPEATVMGRNERLDIMHAAMINGITSHVSRPRLRRYAPGYHHPSRRAGGIRIARSRREARRQRQGLHARVHPRCRG